MSENTIRATQTTLGTAVAPGGTFTMAYPAGVEQAEVRASGHTFNIGQNFYNVGGSTGARVNVAFGSNITVTNNTGLTLPVGTVAVLGVNVIGTSPADLSARLDAVRQVPPGGAAGQVVKANGDGTYGWGADT